MTDPMLRLGCESEVGFQLVPLSRGASNLTVLASVRWPFELGGQGCALAHTLATTGSLSRPLLSLEFCLLFAHAK